MISSSVHAYSHSRAFPICLPFYSADIGLIGLAVMGQNLILNMNGECRRRDG